MHSAAPNIMTVGVRAMNSHGSSMALPKDARKFPIDFRNDKPRNMPVMRTASAARV